jgi:IclR family transcriptional regulator, mhp operon transcriptional activator
MPVSRLFEHLGKSDRLDCARLVFDNDAPTLALAQFPRCQRISWPSDLMVPAGDHMVIAETSQTQTPFLIKAGGIGAR